MCVYNVNMQACPKFGRDGSDAKADIAPPPVHVPEKFKAIWKTLPGCCRDFYTGNRGCCSDLSEPNAASMRAEKAKKSNASPPLDPFVPVKDTVNTRTKPTVKPQPAKSGVVAWVHSVWDWFAEFLKGVWEDLKLLARGPANG